MIFLSTVCSTPYLFTFGTYVIVHIWNISRSNWGRTTTGRLRTQHSKNRKKKKKSGTSNPDIRRKWYGLCSLVRLELFVRRDIRTSSNCYHNPHLALPWETQVGPWIDVLWRHAFPWNFLVFWCYIKLISWEKWKCTTCFQVRTSTNAGLNL